MLQSTHLKNIDMFMTALNLYKRMTKSNGYDMFKNFVKYEFG